MSCGLEIRTSHCDPFTSILGAKHICDMVSSQGSPVISHCCKHGFETLVCLQGRKSIDWTAIRWSSRTLFQEV